MEKFIEFINYLNMEKKMALNSVTAYKKDLIEFEGFLFDRGVGSELTVNNTDLITYILKLKTEGKAGATLNRKIASLRAYYGFLFGIGAITTNPSNNMKSPKIERKKIDYLTIGEIERLIDFPDGSSKGIRDRAILEVLYATGIRVSELSQVNLKDVNLRIGFITCTGEFGKARIIPLGRPARASLEEYIFKARKVLIHNEESKEEALFVNYSGERMSRQGYWKIIKQYAQLAGIENKISPQILRNSFAVHLIQNGADIKSLQELLGHEDMATTKVYLETTKSRIKEVYDKTHPRA
ncbi:MAG: site-specific tyrosine recombinase [Eubacteriales bacterium]